MRDATINTMQKLQDKLDLIQNLTDIKIMYNIINPADIIKEAAYNNYSKLLNLLDVTLFLKARTPLILEIVQIYLIYSSPLRHNYQALF